jgi:hypothetical protein
VAVEIPKEIQEWYEKLPTVSWAELQRQKEEARVRDWERIGRGEATPEQIQRENQIFTDEEMRTFRIVNFEEMLLRSR